MEFKKICKNPECRKSFMGTRTQQYCCTGCRLSSTKNKPKEPCTLDEVTNQAKRLGMSYGKYVAIQYMNQKGRKK